MKKIVINYSGHPLCQETRNVLDLAFDEVVQSESLQFDFSGDADRQLQEIAE